MHDDYYYLLLSYIDRIADQSDDIGQCIFRGQANSMWPLSSSAWRKCSSSLGREPTLEEFSKYHFQLLQKHPCPKCDCSQSPLSDLEMLANMQHYCDKTWLLDFTCNLFVAIWFATSQEEGQDGVVMVLETSNNTMLRQPSEQELERAIARLFEAEFASETGTVCHWHPDVLSNRIYLQECDFLFGHPGKIENLNYKAVSIRQEDKQQLQEELRRFLVLSDRVLAGGLFRDPKDGLQATIHPPTDLEFQAENEILNANEGALMIYNYAIERGFRSFKLYYDRAGHRRLAIEQGPLWIGANVQWDLDRARECDDRVDKRSGSENLGLAQGFANRPTCQKINGLWLPVWPQWR